MIWYRKGYTEGSAFISREFVRETEKFLIDEKGRRTAKQSSWEHWFITPKELLEHELRLSRKAIEQAQIMMDTQKARADKALAALEAL